MATIFIQKAGLRREGVVYHRPLGSEE